jgi:hypothetical protein
MDRSGFTTENFKNSFREELIQAHCYFGGEFVTLSM